MIVKSLCCRAQCVKGLTFLHLLLSQSFFSTVASVMVMDFLFCFVIHFLSLSGGNSLVNGTSDTCIYLYNHCDSGKDTVHHL